MKWSGNGGAPALPCEHGTTHLGCASVLSTQALRFLDAIAGNLDSRAEHSHMERCIRDAIAAVQDNVGVLEKQVADLQSDQRGIDRKLKKAQQELERAEKRMKSLQTVRCVREEGEGRDGCVLTGALGTLVGHVTVWAEGAGSCVRMRLTDCRRMRRGRGPQFLPGV